VIGSADLASFVQAWSKALRGACHVSMARAERGEFLTGLAERLAVALAAEPFDAAAGYWIGADLVAGEFVSPEVLGRTITMLNTQLRAALGPTDDHTVAKLTMLVEALASGFAGASHDRTLDAQEEIRLAALSAQSRAERDLREAEAGLLYLASHDPLTGLPNRTLLLERLAQILTEQASSVRDARLGLCCIGLDGFKAVNDALGRHIGDRLLVAVADRLSDLASASGPVTWAKGSGLLVARLDSDEFALLIEETTSAEDAIKVADRALAVLAEPFHIDDHELPVSASAGVVEAPLAGVESVELLRSADIALHWAKADGKARWALYEQERSAHDAARYRLSAAMPAALRRGEFTLDYQPLVNLADDHLVGVEALARWRHPEHGVLGADWFVGLAEDTGLIVALGARLLEQACRQAVAWQDICADPPYVSVNLAARQIRGAGLVGDVADVLDRTGLSPRRLQLEITEQTVIDTGEQTIANLRALADLGVRVAIDDFGTGYSNLACLRALPLHGIKLAGTLLRGSAGEASAPSDDAFLATLVSLGHTLGFEVTAEGIETEAQAARLCAVGCDIGQGWHLGQAVPADEITDRIRRR
jgi:diguanylate cyclase (GGDEF)-like protein